MPHPGNPIYFKETAPVDWSVNGYVRFQHERSERTPRQISDGWPRSLRNIISCKDDCCTQDEIDQANVHYGRWKNKKTADRKYLSQWLSEQEASKKRARNTNNFNIGSVSVGTLFAGPVENVFNAAESTSTTATTATAVAPAAGVSISDDNSGAAIPPISTSTPAPQPASSVPIGEPPVASAENETFDFQHLLQNFQSTYASMKTRTPLRSGNYLETVVHMTVMSKVMAGYHKMNQIFLWVLDMSDPLMKEWFGAEFLDEVGAIIVPMPVVREEVVYAISKFAGLSTEEQYREHANSPLYMRSPWRYEKEKHFDAAWAHNAMRHLITLIFDTDNLLLSDDLLEGTLECTLWSPLIDLLLTNVFVARRRDSSLLAFKARPDILEGNDPHFDGVVCNHVRTRSPVAGAIQLRAPDEWGIIEVARRNDGKDSYKWKKDSLKMLRGLCALMRYVREYVDYDEETLKKLQFPGLIMAGLETMTVRLACVGNVFVKQEGDIRKVPTSLKTLPEALDMLESLWLFKKMMIDCQDAVKAYVDSKGKDKRPEPLSPNTYFRERVGRPGAL